MHRLLILACSQRKNPARNDLPAIDRYDGPGFRVLRKFLRETPNSPPLVLVLSAKYGLIGSSELIPDYDYQMSAAVAERLRPSVLKRLAIVLQSRPRRWHSIGVCVGSVYSAALIGIETVLPKGAEVEMLGGGQGRRLTRLHAWLRTQRHPTSGRRPERRHAE